MQPETIELTMPQALEGFLLSKAAEGRSPKTLRDYEYCLGMLIQWLDQDGTNPSLASLSTHDLRRFLAHLRARDERPLSPKTIRNVYLAMSSFWSWAATEFGVSNPVTGISVPKAHPPAMRLPTREEISALLKACDYTVEAHAKDGRRFRMRRPTALRDRCIIMVLLDTGLRAQELCSLTIGDVDLKNGSILVRKGKGAKQRIVYCGRATRKRLWRYVATARKDASEGDPLFVAHHSQRPLTRDGLSHLVSGLGRKVGVRVWPHLLRHVFATEFLRGGGNLLALKRLLGHASMALLERYAEIAQADLQAQHASASPLDRWRV